MQPDSRPPLHVVVRHRVICYAAKPAAPLAFCLLSFLPLALILKLSFCILTYTLLRRGDYSNPSRLLAARRRPTIQLISYARSNVWIDRGRATPLGKHKNCASRPPVESFVRPASIFHYLLFSSSFLPPSLIHLTLPMPYPPPLQPIFCHPASTLLSAAACSSLYHSLYKPLSELPKGMA